MLGWCPLVCGVLRAVWAVRPSVRLKRARDPGGGGGGGVSFRTAGGSGRGLSVNVTGMSAIEGVVKAEVGCAFF